MQLSNFPICGFPWSETEEVEEVRNSFDICDCCGCEYGYDDTSAYREQWLKRGAPWWNKKERPPQWYLDRQLQNIITDWDNRRLDLREVFPEIFNNE